VAKVGREVNVDEAGNGSTCCGSIDRDEKVPSMDIKRPIGPCALQRKMKFEVYKLAKSQGGLFR